MPAEMRLRLRRGFGAFAGAVCLFALMLRTPAAADFEKDLKELSSHQTRMPGSKGYEAAADYVEARFREIGLEGSQYAGGQVFRLKFYTTVPQTEACWLELGDKKITIYPMWPNAVALSQTSDEGLSGPLIYAGSGTFFELDGKKLEESIALLEFNSKDRWKNLAMLGGKAVLFLEPKEMISWEALQKFESVPVQMHRFWVPLAAREELLKAAETATNVRIVSRCQWRNVPGYVIYGWINLPEPEKAEESAEEGEETEKKEEPAKEADARPAAEKAAAEKAEAGEEDKEGEQEGEEDEEEDEAMQKRIGEMRSEVIILHASFDATSVVPDIAPGALPAANMAALLQLAEDLVKQRDTLRRPILFLATSARFQIFQGDRDAFWTMTRKFEADNDEIRNIWGETCKAYAAVRNAVYYLDADKHSDVEGLDVIANHLKTEPEWCNPKWYRDMVGDSKEPPAMVKQTFPARWKWWQINLWMFFDQFEWEGMYYRDVQPPEAVLDKLKNRCEMIVSENSEEIIRLGFREKRGRATEEDRKRRAELLKLRNISNIVRYKIGRKKLVEEEKVFLRGIADHSLQSFLNDEQDLRKRCEFLKSARAFRKSLGGRKLQAFVPLAISDAWDVMSVFGPSHYFADERPYVVKTLLTQTSQLVKRAEELMEEDESQAGVFDSQVVKGQRGWRSFLPGRVAFSSEIGLMHGIHSMTLATIQDPRHRLDTPLDKAEYLDRKKFLRQVNFTAALLPKIINDERFGHGRRLEQKVGDVRGRIYLPGVGTSIPRLGVPYCHGTVAPHTAWHFTKTAEVRPEIHLTTDNEGNYWVRSLPQRAVKWYNWRCYPYLTDEFGNVVLAPDASTRKIAGYSDVFGIHRDVQWPKTVAFRGTGLNCFRIFDPAYLSNMYSLDLLDARRNAQPRHYFIDHLSDVALCTGQKDSMVKVLGLRGAIGNRMVLLNASEQEPEGVGYLIDEGRLPAPLPLEAVRSMYWLDEQRLANLRECGIASPLLDELHSTAGQYLRQAEEALQRRQYHRGMGLAVEAWALESRTYPAVKKASNDAIRAVVFLLVLVIPFAYFLERLLLGVVNIYRRIAAFAIIFMIMFFILYKVHPAFKLSMAPVTILLAFFILCMSSMVLFIMFRKFEEQVKSLQGKGARLHQADIGRLGATMAAISLGIGNMRRRKVRTSLTTSTLIMIAFCVLGFASFRSVLRYSEWTVTKDPMRRGLMINQVGWHPLSPHAFAEVDLRCRKGAKAYPRYWICDQPDASQQSSFDLEVSGPSGDSVIFKSVLGLDGEDAHYWRVDAALIGEGSFKEMAGDNRVCVLPSQQAKKLGVTKAGQTVHLRGMDVKVVGIIDEADFESIMGLNDESITPVDFIRESTRKQQEVIPDKIENIRFMEEKRYLHMQAELVLVVPPDLAHAMGGDLRAISVVPGSETDVWELAETLAREVFLPIYVSTGEVVKKLSSTGMADIKGMSDLFLPMLIGALVVLNTMIGSVSERGREIFIYSSIGLAPVHVALLFFAEATVYAVVGGVGGYLLGQVVAQVLSVLERFDMAPPITLNYSSLSAVAVMFLVIGVTLLSTAYPALQAARAAIPGRSRKWRLAPPRGDMWDIECPFTLGAKDAVGVVSFLAEDFANHRESSVGTYFSEGAEIFCDVDKQQLGVRGTTWLAPFDLGVSQNTEIKAGPSDIPGIFQVTILLNRLSGDYGSWKRCNRAFLSHVRKQFLLWRTVHPDVALEYYAKTTAKLEVPFIDEMEDAARAGSQAGEMGIEPTGEAAPA